MADMWMMVSTFVRLNANQAVALAVALAVSTVLYFSNVPPNLVLVSGGLAEALLVAYVMLMLGLAVKPNSLRLHVVTAPIGMAAWAGRSGGFLELVLDLERVDLIGAVAERWMIAIIITVWHVVRVRLITSNQELVFV